jgi:heptose I phosphotransferase
MFWIHPEYRTTLKAAAADGYDALAALVPIDDFHEKQGRSTGRYRLSGGGEPVRLYLKKYMRLPWWQRWLAPIGGFPGPRELANLERAAALGIAVPEPVVAGADRHHRCKSLLATRELEGYLPLHEFIPARFAAVRTHEERALKRALIERLAEVARRLHSAKLFHRDFYLCHFFIRERPQRASRFNLVLIDLGRLRYSKLPRWRVKDLAQLLFSSDLPGITRTDRLRFFRCYLGLARLDVAARRLLRRIERKATRYHRHNTANASSAQRGVIFGHTSSMPSS